MTRGRGMYRVSAAVAALLLAAAGCQPGGAGAPTAKAVPPAKVEGAPKEAELSTVKLTTEAEGRLGVVTALVEKKAAPRTASYAGEVIIPPGRLISVSSPFVGTLKTPKGGKIPAPGAIVKEGQPVFVLVPILSPESMAMLAPQLIDAEGQVKTATEQLQISKTTLDRAEKLLADRLGGSAALVDAKANYSLAQTTLRAAEARRETLTKVSADAKTGSMSQQTIEAPASGMIQNVHANVGQKVAAGMALFEVASVDPVWVKVAVFVGDLPKMAIDKEAVVGGLADMPGATGGRAGKPVAAPPSADPLAATANVFYEVDNKDGLLRPGQRVGVTLPLKGDELSLTVPRASLITDIHGGTWVYEEVGEHKYARRRVMVDRVVGEVGVLVSGPKPGAKVVTDGAAEIYGTEFGYTK